MNPYSFLCMHCAMAMAASGHFGQGRVFAQKALRNAMALNDLLGLGTAEMANGLVSSFQGDWKSSLEHLRKSAEYCDAAKFLIVSALVRCAIGLAWCMLGEPGTARDHVKTAMELHRGSGVEMHLAASYHFAAFVHSELGDRESARDLVQEGLRLSQKNNEKAIEGRSMVLLGTILGLGGASETDEAAEVILNGIEILKELGARAFYSLGYLFLGEVYLNAGRSDRARENLMKADGMFQEMGMAYWLTRTRGILSRMNS